jgi:hypothetical protein
MYVGRFKICSTMLRGSNKVVQNFTTLGLIFIMACPPELNSVSFGCSYHYCCNMIGLVTFNVLVGF